MELISQPSTSLRGEIEVPGDKSISHRTIMLGAIAKGTTVVHGFLMGEDCLATMQAFLAMGVPIERLSDKTIVIQGVGKQGLNAPSHPIDCGNSGTTMRLLAGLLAAQPFSSTLTGDQSLLKRPMGRITHPLIQMGADITACDGRPPLVIHPVPRLKGMTYDMPEASAQVKSCLMLAGMYAEGETTLIERKQTRDHTERMLTAFGYPYHQSGQTIIINAAGDCHGTELTVPGDISSAAFFIIAATLIPNSDILIRNVGINDARIGIIHILKHMGASIEISDQRLSGQEPVADLRVRSANLQGIHIPVDLVPSAIDEFPVIFIAAACAKGQTIVRGAKELRYKESDRIRVMVDGLQALGIDARELDDGVEIHGGVLQGGVIDSCHDHRVAMAFAIAGAVAKQPVTIQHCESITTSFPSFVSIANQLNMVIDYAASK